jgi:plasmid stability protein
MEVAAAGPAYLSAYLDPSLKQALRELAARNAHSMSDELRLAVDAWVRAHTIGEGADA